MLKEQLKSMTITAMKEKEKEELAALRNISSAAQSKALANKRKETTDEDIEAIVLKLNIEAKEGIEFYSNVVETSPCASSKESAQRNLDRNVILSRITGSFLPEKISEYSVISSIDAIISETGASTMKDMGSVMKAFNEKHAKGSFDGKFVSTKVRELLS